MDEEQNNALAIAELTGEVKAIRGETNAMEARIDSSLNQLRTGVDSSLNQLRTGVDASLVRMAEDAARRDASVDANFERLERKMAERDTEAARRDKDNQRWVIGLVLLCTGVVIAAVALL